MRRTRRENRFCWLLVTLLLTSFLLPPVFGTNPSEKEKGLPTEEETVLFTPEGYYRAPPTLPDEVRENLSLWQLPEYEKQLSEGKMLTTSYSDGTIELYDGWNLVSIPKKLLSGYDTAGTVFAGLDSGGRPIFHYNGSTQWWDQVLTGTVLKPLEGYYVYSVGPFTLNTVYSTAQTNPSTTLYPGWNMIGYFDPLGNPADDYFHAAMARDELAQLGGSWSEIQGFDPITQQYETSIINGGSDIHSDYRLMYPGKGYWIWMDSQHSFVFSVTHTYYCSTEWVGEYPGNDLDLPDSQDNAEGFYDTLSWGSSWDGAFIRGDNDNPMARAADWKDSSYSGGMDDNPSTGIDTTNFAYFSGHGWPGGGILFAFGYPDRNEQELWYNEAIWGDTKADWIALDACSVLDESNNNYAVWQDSFKGLHSIVGWDTTGMCSEDTGLLFASNLLDGLTIWESWKDATDSVIHIPGYKVGILAVDLDGNTNTKECIDDHIYGQGTWFSPPGYDVQFDTDFHSCIP